MAVLLLKATKLRSLFHHLIIALIIALCFFIIIVLTGIARVNVSRMKLTIIRGPIKRCYHQS